LTIFEAAGTGIDANLSSIIIGIVIMISVCFNTLLIDRAGRRVLMMISQLGMALAVSGIGIFFYLKNRNDGVTPEGLAVLPLVSLLAFMLLYNVGAGPIPFLMMGELLPSRIRGETFLVPLKLTSYKITQTNNEESILFIRFIGFGCALATSFNWLLAFIVTKTFESLTILLGIDGCFFLFAGICLLGLLFCALFVPETKGKSFDEIQKQYFSK
jgi:facilitated trehalose transporter